MPDAYVHQPGASERRWLGDSYTDFLATGEQTGDAFTLVDERARRGESVPLHRHDEDVESFYVVEGEIEFFIGDGPGVVAVPGAFVHVPGGTVHGFRIASEAARYLILTTARHGEFYRAITLPSMPGGEPPDESLDEGQIEQACGEYGVEFVGPLPGG